MESIKETILISSEDEFFSIMRKFMADEIRNLKLRGADNDDILIYIPLYLLARFVAWDKERHSLQHKNPNLVMKIDPATVHSYRGVKVLNNYENTVVVSHTEAALRQGDFTAGKLKVW